MRKIYKKKYNIFSWNLLKKAWNKYKRDGFFPLLFLGFRISIKPLKYLYLNTIQSNKEFIFNGKSYKYFYHWHHFTWENDRQVEIPIALEYVKENKGKEILEIGNVLSNFYKFPHTIVDKYEEEEGVINEDIIDFNPQKKYDFIISISTFEHIGYNETIKDSKKVLKAIEKVKDLLKPGGSILITCPLGHTPHLDKFLQDGTIKFDEEHYLKRISFNEWKSKWVEIGRKDAFKDLKNKAPYDRIIVGILR